MKICITGKWSNGFSQDGLLFCCQRIEEMLYNYSSHLYKVPVLNTYLLAREFLDICTAVGENRAYESHLKTVLDEFIYSFTTDIVIKEHIPGDRIVYFRERLQSSSIENQHRIMDYLLQTMSDYPVWCEETLRKAVDNPAGKKDIDKALRSYIPIVICRGYNPHFIYRRCVKLFTQNVCDMSVFEEFLETFNGIDKDYTVYFFVDRNISDYKCSFWKVFNLSFESDAVSEKFEYDRNKKVCVHKKISALDYYGAAQRTNNLFDWFVMYYRFLGNRDRKPVWNKCFVYDSEGMEHKIDFGRDLFYYSWNSNDSVLVKKSEQIFDQLVYNASGESDTINKVIQAHNTALSSNDISNTLVNLWSVIEIIGVDGHIDGKSKIEQILDNIVPVLTRNYINNIVEELNRYIKYCLPKDKYDELMLSLSETGTECYKIACLIALHEYDDVRTKVCHDLGDYPIVRSRICQLSSDVFNKKSCFIKEVTRFEQRISWHIQRLYRTTE